MRMEDDLYDKEKLKAHFNYDSSPGYQSGFVEAMKLFNVKPDDFEYITGHPYEYWV